MAETGTDLVVPAPGARMRWLPGFAPQPVDRLCLALIGTDRAGFVMPRLNAADARRHTDLPFRDWTDAQGTARRVPTRWFMWRRAPGRSRCTRRCGPITCWPSLTRCRVRHAALPPGRRARCALSRTPPTSPRCERTPVSTTPRRRRGAAQPGATGRDLADAARAAFAAAGARPQFGIVGTGGNSAFPHHHAGTTPVRPGDAIIVDTGGEKGGSFSDITRMAAFGAPPDGH
jgi:hypothetical protein